MEAGFAEEDGSLCLTELRYFLEVDTELGRLRCWNRELLQATGRWETKDLDKHTGIMGKLRCG